MVQSGRKTFARHFHGLQWSGHDRIRKLGLREQSGVAGLQMLDAFGFVVEMTDDIGQVD